MSGGYIDELDENEHQVVIVTLKGPIKPEHAHKWNQALHDFKQAVGQNVIAVTLDGNKTPKNFRK
jgi:hypothetical protein